MPLPSVVSPSRTSQPEKGLFLIKMTFFFLFPLPSCFLWLQLRAVLHPMTQPERGRSLSPTLRDCFRPGLCRSSKLLPYGVPYSWGLSGAEPCEHELLLLRAWVLCVGSKPCPTGVCYFSFPFSFPCVGLSQASFRLLGVFAAPSGNV